MTSRLLTGEILKISRLLPLPLPTLLGTPDSQEKERNWVFIGTSKGKLLVCFMSLLSLISLGSIIKEFC